MTGLTNEQAAAQGRFGDATDRDYDTTQLRAQGYHYRVHRDYLAHVLRWGWAGRFIGHTERTANRVLEPGCGQDLPLWRAITAMQQWVPELFVGVDLNRIPWVRKRKPDTYPWTDMREEFNFVEQWPELLEQYGSTFDLAVSFEVIEHMTVALGDRYLEGIYELLAPGGEMLLSTPVFNGRRAKNHIHEYEIPELRDKIEAAGFVIVDRLGTFANWNDVKRGLDEMACGDELRKVYDRLMEFYDPAMLACFMAPALPDHSRNNVWRCIKPGGDVILEPVAIGVMDDLYAPRPKPASGGGWPHDLFDEVLEQLTAVGDGGERSEDDERITTQFRAFRDAMAVDRGDDTEES